MYMEITSAGQVRYGPHLTLGAARVASVRQDCHGPTSHGALLGLPVLAEVTMGPPHKGRCLGYHASVGAMCREIRGEST